MSLQNFGNAYRQKTKIGKWMMHLKTAKWNVLDLLHRTISSILPFVFIVSWHATLLCTICSCSGHVFDKFGDIVPFFLPCLYKFGKTYFLNLGVNGSNVLCFFVGHHPEPSWWNTCWICTSAGLPHSSHRMQICWAHWENWSSFWKEVGG